MEVELVQRAGIPFRTIPAAGLHGVGLRALPRNAARLLQGYRHAQGILREFRPDVLFLTGGYLAAPVALAGRRTPMLIYVPDIEPGLALKSLARFADRICVTAEASRRYFPREDRVVVTGYPTRPELADWDRTRAVEHLGLDPDLPTLLVFGGSRGAQSINRALLQVLPSILDIVQVVHISGEYGWQEVQLAAGSLRADQLERYRYFAYLHEMGAAFAAADLVLARAGAATLGEFPLFGLPALLVPYPHTWRYQQVNAEYLAQTGAAVIIDDSALVRELVPTVRDLFKSPERLDAMRAAMHALERPQASEKIAGELRDLVAKGLGGN